MDVTRRETGACQRCRNAAYTQHLSGRDLYLCEWCYADVFDDIRERRGDEEGDFDLADRWPQLLSDDIVSLRPVVGPGWHRIVDDFCRAVANRMTTNDVVWISDIKEKFGQLSIDYSSNFDIDDLEERAVCRAEITCALCSHQGGRARGRYASSLLCNACTLKQWSEN